MEVAERVKEAQAFEAEEADYRVPNRPNKRALLTKKCAVIMLAWKPDQYGDEIGKPADRDMELFDDLAAARRYFEVSSEWAQNDYDKHGDMLHVTMLCPDTGDCFEDGLGDGMEILIAGGTASWQTQIVNAYKGDPKAVFSITRRERIQREHQQVKKPADKQREPIKRVGLKKPNAKKAKGKKVQRNSAAPIRQDVKKPVRRVKKPVQKKGA